MKKSKKKEITVTWTFEVPKTPEEKEEQERRLSAGYAIIFNEMKKRKAELRTAETFGTTRKSIH